MKAKLQYTFWKEKEWWIGYFNEFPSYMTQGESLDELKKSA